MSNQLKLQTVLIAITLVLSLVNLYGVYNLYQTGVSAAQPQPQVLGQEQQLGPVDVSVDDDPVKGAESAPIIMIEFSDFECPFCGRFYTETLPQIQENYIDTGKVKLVFRDFPLPFHPNAQKASEAAECADEQSKFWEMHDVLFEHQTALSSANLKQYAADLGLDTDQFNDCLDSGKFADEVKKDNTDGQIVGVSGTPTFFINGIQITGAQPYAAFEQVIEAELAK
ncbi:disulfide bond formation protein DsbA [Candidatus Woesearchaeota archaeon CG10_big_fil_rev_8_21_14_0_10_37_12]|nr:MAG: disulfide bond formation protein DsbA [Candidatus Woesearchaeota archaeon CG10_big_fil_rev_8_21_14_0_10_37_12]